MTTTVTVKTHSWPVKVSAFPLLSREPLVDGKWQEIGRVEPNSERSFVVHDGQDICVQELAIPPAEQADPA